MLGTKSTCDSNRISLCHVNKEDNAMVSLVSVRQKRFVHNLTCRKLQHCCQNTCLRKSWCGSQSSTSCLRLGVAELLIEALCRSANVTVLSFVRTAFKIQLVRCDRALPIKTSSGLTDIEQTSDHGYFRHRHQRMLFFRTVAVVM